MDNEAFWYFWFILIFTIIGWAIGSYRGKPLVGFLAGLLLGPIGCLLTCLGPNLRKDKEKKEQQALMQQQIALQRAQLEAMQRYQSSASPVSIPPPPGSKKTMRIAKDGQDLGDIDIPKVKLMLKTGELTNQDYYFDLEANEWMTLDCNPSL